MDQNEALSSMCKIAVRIAAILAADYNATHMMLKGSRALRLRTL